MQSSVRLFADDALLYGIVAIDADCDLLQSGLHRLESWQHLWHMEFNLSNGKIVTISHKINPPLRKYVFCGVELEQVDSFPYLGVTISNKLNWSAPVSITAAKIKGLFHRKFLCESGEIFWKMAGKLDEIITAQQDIKTREIGNLFRECHRKIGRIFQISGRG